MRFSGYQVVVVATDPVPAGMRVGAGVLLLTPAEAARLEAGDDGIRHKLWRAIEAHERRQLRQTLRMAGMR